MARTKKNALPALPAVPKVDKRTKAYKRQVALTKAIENNKKQALIQQKQDMIRLKSKNNEKMVRQFEMTKAIENNQRYEKKQALIKHQREMRKLQQEINEKMERLNILKLKTKETNRKVAIKRISKAFKNYQEKFSYSYKIVGLKKITEVEYLFFHQRNQQRRANGQRRARNIIEYDGNRYFRFDEIGVIRLTKRMIRKHYEVYYDEDMGERTCDYHLFLNFFSEHSGNIKQYYINRINDVLSQIDLVMLEEEVKVRNINPNQINHQALNEAFIFNSSNHQTMENEFLVNRINKNSTSPKDLFINYVDLTKNGNKIACGVDLIMTLKEKWDANFKDKLTVSLILKDFDRLCKKYKLTYINDKGKIGVNNILMGYWCLEVGKIGFKVIDDNGVLLYPKQPEHQELFKNQSVSGRLNCQCMYAIQSNGHYYLITDKIHSIKHLIKTNEHSTVNEASDKCFVLSNNKRLNEKFETIVMKDVSEIYTIIKNATQTTKVYYVESITDILDYFMNVLKHKPQPIGDVLSPTGCYIVLSKDAEPEKKEKHILDDDENVSNKKIEEDEIKISFFSLANNVKTVDDTLEDLTKEQMILYNETRDNIYEKFFVNDYISEYSDDLKSSFDEFPNSLYINFTKSTKDLYGIDFNKSYAYQTSKIKQFGKFALFDEYQEYDGHAIEDCTEYKCKFVNVSQTPYDKICSYRKEAEQTFVTYGLFLKYYKEFISEFTILKFNRPYEIVNNPICDDIQNIYSLNIPKSLCKGIPNIFIGKCFKRHNSNKKAFLSTKQEELVYLQNEIQKSKPESKSTFTPIVAL